MMGLARRAASGAEQTTPTFDEVIEQEHA